MLANLYLDELDENLLARGLKCVRFADDFIILCKDEAAAVEALRITDQLVEALDLRLRENSGIGRFDEGFRYLGTLFFRDLALTIEKKKPAHQRQNISPLVSLRSMAAEAAASGTQIGQALSNLTTELAVSGADVYLRPAAKPKGEPVDEAALERPTPLRKASVLPHATKQSLYVTEQGCTIAKEGGRLLVRRAGETVLDVPIFKVDRIVIFGNSTLTTPAVHSCLENNVDVNFLSLTGRYYGVLEAPSLKTCCYSAASAASLKCSRTASSRCRSLEL